VIVLRDYQQRAIDDVRQAIAAGHRRVLLQAPTGSGKTVLMAFMASGAARRGKRTMFVVHRQELLYQASATFDAQGIDHGIIAPGHSMTRDPIQVASVQTLVRRLDRVAPPDLMIFDEAHHCPSSTWRRVFQRYPEAKMVGLTATPTRLDGRGLDDLFDVMVRGPGVRELIDTGYLSDYTVYAPPIGIDVSAVRTRAGDFAKEQLAGAVDKPTITGDAVRHYLRFARGRRAIAFCVSIAHSEHVATQFQAVGVTAQHIDGKEDSRRRRRIMERFAAGDIQVLTNCDLVSEGLDVPGVEAAILLRPTQSLSLYLQQVGRALRPQPGKTAIILDHAGNVLRHGLPDDEREWTLQGRPRKRGKGERPPEVRVTQCPVCFACHAPAPICPACGHVYETQGRDIEHVEGELERIDADEFRRQRQREVGRARTLEELEAIAETRGYSKGWAFHIYRARQRKRGRVAA
jgi:superfamily II DNA or RNA helicase